jgi:hypothetical protein
MALRYSYNVNDGVWKLDPFGKYTSPAAVAHDNGMPVSSFPPLGSTDEIFIGRGVDAYGNRYLLPQASLPHSQSDGKKRFIQYLASLKNQ